MKRIVIIFSLAVFLSGCNPDTSLPPYEATIFLEDFEEVQDGVPLDISEWTNFSDIGGTNWHGEVYNGNGYAAFENTGNVPITSWLVSPAIDLGQKQRTLKFLSAQHHLIAVSSLQVFITTDFNGDPETTDWIPLEVITADIDNQWYSFISSGEISLEAYTGIAHIGFKASIENQGAYFIDNVKVY